MTTPQSAKAKGRRLEHKTAAVLGGTRTILSGGAGGNDITIPSAGIWADWAVECKSRKRMTWTTVWQALAQARAAARGTPKLPAAVVKEDRGPMVFSCYLADLVQWAEALAEVGNGAAIRSHLRAIEQQLSEIGRLAR